MPKSSAPKLRLAAQPEGDVGRAATAVSQAYALAAVLTHYYTSPVTEEAPLRETTMLSYANLLSEKLIIAMHELNPMCGLGKWGEWDEQESDLGRTA